MANTKISALTSATTPLDGTEVLPIVQSSATVKVATNDLTVRNVRANTTTGILQITGPAAASTRIATVPNANWTAARTDAAQTFTGSQTFSGSVTSTLGYSNTSDVGIISNTGIPGISLRSTSNGRFTLIQNYSAGNLTQFLVGTGTSNPTTETLRLDGATGLVTAMNGFSVTGNATLSTGNLVQGTAAKGISYTANTPAAGMTSQLLNWYEEGTWTPADASGAGLTFTSVTAKYTRIGRQVTATMVLTFPSTVSTAQAQISGLPFAASNFGQFLGIRTGVAGASSGLVSASGTTIVLYTQAGGSQTNAANSTATLYLTGTYFV